MTPKAKRTPPKKVLRLVDLTPEQRRIVLALINLAESSKVQR